MNINDRFRRYALLASDAVGSVSGFFTGCALVVLWAAIGPLLRFSDTWQLIINTGTSILTFLIVFLIQYAQNRDTRAIRLKLDELILSVKGERSAAIDLDRLSEAELEDLEEHLRRWHQQHRRNNPSGAGSPSESA
jgi:low affinity Fe/Cu permease